MCVGGGGGGGYGGGVLIYFHITHIMLTELLVWARQIFLGHCIVCDFY